MHNVACGMYLSNKYCNKLYNHSLHPRLPPPNYVKQKGKLQIIAIEYYVITSKRIISIILDVVNDSEAYILGESRSIIIKFNAIAIDECCQHLNWQVGK